MKSLDFTKQQTMHRDPFQLTFDFSNEKRRTPSLRTPMHSYRQVQIPIKFILSLIRQSRSIGWLKIGIESIDHSLWKQPNFWNIIYNNLCYLWFFILWLQNIVYTLLRIKRFNRSISCFDKISIWNKSFAKLLIFDFWT